MFVFIDDLLELVALGHRGRQVGQVVFLADQLAVLFFPRFPRVHGRGVGTGRAVLEALGGHAQAQLVQGLDLLPAHVVFAFDQVKELPVGHGLLAEIGRGKTVAGQLVFRGRDLASHPVREVSGVERHLR